MKMIIALLALTAYTIYSSYASGFCDAMPPQTFYADTDNDGYGDASNSITGSWPPPPGYVDNSLDCNDNNNGIHPNALEVCNGIDDNCDGLIDDNDPAVIGQNVYFADADGDGFGDETIWSYFCSPSGYVEWAYYWDCDDSNTAINPSALEISCNGIDDNCNGVIDEEACNGIDDDCDGLIDEGVIPTFFIDYDGDGHYNPVVTIIGCTAPLGWVGGVGFGVENVGSGAADCYDSEYGAGDCLERCNGIDDDGDGLIDDADPAVIAAQIPWYADADGDGYGDLETWVMAACAPPEGYLPWPNNIDCDDSNPAIHLGAQELCNGIDDDCDGVIDPENCNSLDTDCDGVPDDFDVCPGGDDSMDSNGDNIPDCSQMLNYNDYSPDWHCANNKIYVCHNDNNPQTICIDANSLLPAHFGHGDMIGPCTSCGEQNLSIPESHNASFDADASGLTVFPNPAGDEVKVYLHSMQSATVLTISNQFGQEMWKERMGKEQYETEISLDNDRFPNGIYLVSAVSNGGIYTKWLVIAR